MTRFAMMAGVIAAVLLLAGCGKSNGEQAATSTPDEMLVIVTLTPVPSATVRSEIVSYIVAEGDTLLDIAIRFGVTPEEIVAVNNLADQDSIFVGQNLSIPAPSDATPDDS